MSVLGDKIVHYGPFYAGQPMIFPTAPNGHPIITAKEMNELREELIRLRAIAATEQPPLD